MPGEHDQLVRQDGSTHLKMHTMGGPSAVTCNNADPCPGLLNVDELLESLGRSGDALGATATLQLLEDLSRSVDVNAAGLLTTTAVPRLLAMTRSGDPMLRAQALQVRPCKHVRRQVSRACTALLPRTMLEDRVRRGLQCRPRE